MNSRVPVDDEIPAQGRLLGIDFGTVRIGLAVCDAQQTMAGPWATRVRQTPELDAVYFRKLVEAEAIVGCVIGLPLHLSGRPSQKSEAVLAFARWLKEIVQRPIAFYDERFSSAAAEELIGGELTKKQRRGRIDKIAAQLILSGYLDSHRQSGTWQQGIDG